MYKNYENLIDEFKNISAKRWTKGINNYTNSAGITFESLLNKKADSMFFPDYQGIEIKCTQRFSRYPITLFSLAFDGPSLYEMNRILGKYGKNDVIYKDKKLLNIEINSNIKTIINNKCYLKIDVSKDEQKIYLSSYDLNDKLIEKEAYINFETLKQRLELKLSALALVYASKKLINNETYFRYYKIEIYNLISFEKFIELIENNIIKISIIGRISRSGNDKGRQRNKNLVFQIKKEDINKLFKTVKYYNSDLNSNFQII